MIFPVPPTLDSCDSDRATDLQTSVLRQTDMSEREEEVKQKANDSRKAEERILGLMKASFFFFKPFILYIFFCGPGHCYGARCAMCKATFGEVHLTYASWKVFLIRSGQRLQ